jgi:hypothetical protein
VTVPSVPKPRLNGKRSNARSFAARRNPAHRQSGCHADLAARERSRLIEGGLGSNGGCVRAPATEPLPEPMGLALQPVVRLSLRLVTSPGTKIPAASSLQHPRFQGASRHTQATARKHPQCTPWEAHMRKALVLAAGLTLVATSAWSQSSRDRGDYDRSDWRETRGGWERGLDDRRSDDRRSDDRRERSMRDDEGRPATGARFFLRSGDTQLRVVCDERESTRACVDAALTMFDRVRPRQDSTSGSPGSPPPTSPPSR